MSNKATRFNRKMSMASAVFAIILLGCVFGMLYYSFQNVKEKSKTIKNLYSIRFDKGLNDSLSVAVNDSVVFTGITNDTVFVAADGDNKQNMISIEDFTTKQSLNSDLPAERSAVVISGNNGKLAVETMKVMGPGN
jgi:hypothetical protein